MANGRGGFLDDTDSLADEPVLAVGAVNGGSGNVRIWQAAPLSQETVAALYQTQFTKNEEVVWDSREQAVAARKRVSFRAFIIEETPLRNGDASLAGPDGASGAFGYPGTRCRVCRGRKSCINGGCASSCCGPWIKAGTGPTFRKKRS